MHTIISIGIGILIGICVTVIAIVVIADMGAEQDRKKRAGKR